MFKNLINRMFEPKMPKFSLERLKQLHAQLSKHKEVKDNQEVVVETLRSISELVVWGDQNNPAVWDFFLEKNILEYFFYVLEHKNSTITIKKQLIQTLSIMIQNLNTKNSLFFLLSNNKVNDLIEHEFDFNSDEELLAYYITFLKTISLKLDVEMVQFFFDNEKRRFQLYERAIDFVDSRENMVQIAVRTITLNIFSVQDRAMHEYVAETSDGYFERMALYTWDQFLKISTLISDNNTSALETICADQLDHLWYLSDVFQSPIGPYIQEKLRKIIMRSAVSPFLTDDDIQLPVKLFFVSQLFLVFSYPAFVCDLFEFVFGDWLSLSKIEEILSTGKETEISAMLGVIYAVLTNRGVKPEHLAQLELYKIPKTSDILIWSPISVTLMDNASTTTTDTTTTTTTTHLDTSNRIHVTITAREFNPEQTFAEHPDSADILATYQDRWWRNLIKLLSPPDNPHNNNRLNKIVSYHLVLRVLDALDIKYTEYHYETIRNNLLEIYQKQLYQRYDSMNFVEFCNYMGIQYANYYHLTKLKGDQLFGDPMLLLSQPPSSLPIHSRTPSNSEEELCELAHLVILCHRLIALPHDKEIALELTCHLGTPKTPGSQIPLPHNMSYVYCSPYFDYCATRDHKNKKYGVVLDSFALYFVETGGCPAGYAKVAIAMPLFFTKCRKETDTRNMLRIVCSQKVNSSATITLSHLCDFMVIFDDAQKCDRGSHVINKAITHAVEERRRVACKLFDWPLCSPQATSPSSATAATATTTVVKKVLEEQEVAATDNNDSDTSHNDTNDQQHPSSVNEAPQDQHDQITTDEETSQEPDEQTKTETDNEQTL